MLGTNSRMIAGTINAFDAFDDTLAVDVPNLGIFATAGCRDAYGTCVTYGATDTVDQNTRAFGACSAPGGSVARACPAGTRDIGVGLECGFAAAEQRLCLPSCGLVPGACAAAGVTGAPGGTNQRGLCPTLAGVAPASAVFLPGGGDADAFGGPVWPAQCNYDVDAIMAAPSVGMAGSGVRQWVDQFAGGGDGVSLPPSIITNGTRQYDAVMRTYCAQQQGDCPGNPDRDACARMDASAASDGDLCRRWAAA